MRPAIYCILFVAFISSLSCKKEDNSLPLELAFQNAMIEEINFARTNPSGYAESRLLTDFKAGTDNGAYLDLKSRNGVSALGPKVPLYKAAHKYAVYMAVNDVFGHNENGSPQTRVGAERYNFYNGENIAFSFFANYNASSNAELSAQEFVRLFIIDKGVPGVGHRNNILSSTHKVVGCGYAEASDGAYYTVQDFGSR